MWNWILLGQKTELDGYRTFDETFTVTDQFSVWIETDFTAPELFDETFKITDQFSVCIET